MLYNDTIAYNQSAIRYSGINYTTVGVLTTQVTSSQDEIITESSIIYIIPNSEIYFVSNQDNEIYSSESSISSNQSLAEISFDIQN